MNWYLIKTNVSEISAQLNSGFNSVQKRKYAEEALHFTGSAQTLHRLRLVEGLVMLDKVERHT